MKKKVDLILDSGAFSAWKKGLEIDVDDYADFALAKMECLHKVVNLDRIPGEWGRVPSPAEVEGSAKHGMKNLKRLRKRGIDAMPVFHQGERFYWLDKMIGEGFDWIGISPANDRTTKQKRAWLDEVFTHLCGDHGYPQVKTHGFGVTALPIIFAYPWYSVDSTTWLLQPSYGKLHIPSPKPGGGYDFTKAPGVVAVSETREGRQASAQAMLPGEHIKTMGKSEREYVEQYVKDMGMDMGEMVEHFKFRCKLSAKFFLEMEKAYVPPPWRSKRDTFFGAHKATPHGTTENKWPRIRMFFTVPTSRQHSWALTQVGARDRLLTYFYFMDGQNSSWSWEEYVQTGNISVDKPRKRKIKRKKLKA